MGRQAVRTVTNDPIFQREVEAQVRRLREMLVLMAPETGASALGATLSRFGAQHPDLQKRITGVRRLLPLPPPSPPSQAA